MNKGGDPINEAKMADIGYVMAFYVRIIVMQSFKI
jgi:hypothetical protein